MTEYDICNTALTYIGQTETITDYTSNTICLNNEHPLFKQIVS